MNRRTAYRTLVVSMILGVLMPVVATASFVDTSSSPFGNFEGVDYLIHTGRFEGTTSRGDFRVPFQIVAPADPTAGNPTLLVEPPHFVSGTAGRDLVLGHDLIFGRGVRHASVGFGLNGLNILDPAADDLVIAGNPIVPPVFINLAAMVDVEIVVQFTQALTTDPFGVANLGDIESRYSFGMSQTSAVLLETLHRPDGQDLYDLTLLYIPLWRPIFEFPGVFEALDATGGVFTPLTGVGRVVFVESEGDQIASGSEQFRSATSDTNYRVYETAGSAHVTTPLNPLDHSMVMRAVFVRADEWVQWGVEPPASTLISTDVAGGNDPVYGFPTGIARDGDGNALGGVRLPDIEVGRAQYIAADFSIGPLPGLFGDSIDLACAPEAGSSGGPRFASHGDYVSRFVQQANVLRNAGFLLDEDADSLKKQAAESAVGDPGTCP